MPQSAESSLIVLHSREEHEHKSTCSTCGNESEFSSHFELSTEPHGETVEQQWLTCDLCGAATDAKELEEQQMATNGTGNYVKFAVNIPQELALRYTDGTGIQGRYGPQVVFTLTDGRKLYTEPKVADRIRALKVMPGQKLRMCKREATPGNSRSVFWDVDPVESRIGQMLDQAQSLDSPYTEPEGPPITKLEHALKTVLVAAKAAEQYSQEIGHPIQFDKDDIRSMAITLVINQSRERAA